MLSLSGHYHPGQPAHALGNTTVYTVPAACETPFRFAHVTVRDREIDVREHGLRMETPGLVDVHCHTEYAYCATTVAAEANVRVARALGLRRQCLTEHAFQLYFEDRGLAWSGRWQTEPDVVRQAWAAGRGKMEAYRRFAGSMRSDFVRLGLEVDLLADGALLLADEDRDGWDLLVGCVHYLPGFEKGVTTPAETERLFFDHTARLLEQPIQVLAHPFRFFRRLGAGQPRGLYVPLAGLLAEHGVAAEVNFHTNRPDPRFVAACVERGVKIALGSDSHDLAEVGEFHPHLEVLRRAGVRNEDLPDILYQPE
jgi:histidinol phosphatase-like PHP family hydrolase